MQVRSNGRVHRTAPEWREILSRHASSGLSVAAFCKREALTTSTFQRWSAKLRPRSEPFVELAVPRSGPAPASAPSAWTIELELPGDILLRVRG